MSDIEEKTDNLDPALKRIIYFLVQIGFNVLRRDLPDDTFLPGIATVSYVIL